MNQKLLHLDKTSAPAKMPASIPAKPLVQAKLKRGGFFIQTQQPTP